MKENINSTVSVLQCIIIMVHSVTSSSYRSVDCTVAGFDLAWFSCLSSKHLCIFDVVVLYIIYFLLLYLLFCSSDLVD